MTARRLTGLLFASALIVAAACGSEGSGISSTAADELEVAVHDIRAAIDQGDLEGASQLTAQLEAAVLQWTSMGHITGDRAVRITQAIDGLESELAARLQATTTTTTTTTTTSTTTTVAPTTTTSTTTTSTTSTTAKPKGAGDKADDNKGNKKEKEKEKKEKRRKRDDD